MSELRRTVFDHRSNSSEKFSAKLLLLNGEFRERGLYEFVK